MADHPCQAFLKAATEMKTAFNEIMRCEEEMAPYPKDKAHLGLECHNTFIYIEKARLVLCKDCTHSPECEAW